MNITWLGHSCFAVESAGWRIVLDPYYVETYPALHVDADEVLCSHSHRDHAFLEAVTLSGRNRAASPFTVETVSTFHDEKGGALRGENTIHILRAEGLTLVHCGDLGHELSGAQLEELGSIDVLLIPVGGYYTIDAAQAKRITDAVKPRIIVPMHYRRGAQGLQQVCGVDRFLELFRSADIRMLSRHSLEITADTEPGVYVFPWPELLYSKEAQTE